MLQGMMCVRLHAYLTNLIGNANTLIKIQRLMEPPSEALKLH